MKITKNFTKSGLDSIEIYKKLINEKNALYHFILIDVDMPEMNGSAVC